MFYVKIQLEADIRGDEMAREIRITKKSARRGDDGHKVVSVRMKEETLARLDALSGETNRSRNELINLLLVAALEEVRIEDAPEE